MGRKPKQFQGPTEEELRASELNNFDHDLVTEDFGDSPFADRLPLDDDNDEDEYNTHEENF